MKSVAANPRLTGINKGQANKNLLWVQEYLTIHVVDYINLFPKEDSIPLGQRKVNYLKKLLN